VNTACHAINRLYLHRLLKKTSYKLLTGNKPNVSYFRVFGSKCYILVKKGSVGEEISPAWWRIAPALNPKERRGLSVFLATRLVDQHTRAREGLEWFGPLERNTLLHCVMYCLGPCMNL
jgi:hypothetical protein